MRNVSSMSPTEAMNEDLAISALMLGHMVLIFIALIAALVSSFWAEMPFLTNALVLGTYLFIDRGLDSVMECATAYKEALKRIYSSNTD